MTIREQIDLTSALAKAEWDEATSRTDVVGPEWDGFASRAYAYEAMLKVLNHGG